MTDNPASYKTECATAGARCLFVCTTRFNTLILRSVADALPDWDCWFTPIYSAQNIAYKLAHKLGLAQRTQLSPENQRKVTRYLEEFNLRIDFGAKASYDIVVLVSDIFVPQNLRSKHPKVLVQEGWVWPRGWRRWLCQHSPLPPWFAGASGLGLSGNYDYFCVASQGYKDLFVQSGIEERKIVVTGIPTLDAVQQDFASLVNQTQESEFVLVTTHAGREYFEGEDRRALLMKARRVANGRPIIVKLHPYENHVRAIREVTEWLPEAEVVVDADVNRLIASCSVLVTTYSTTIFYALLLEKEVHCQYPTNQILKLLPEQNGQAARRIAGVCRMALAEAIGTR